MLYLILLFSIILLNNLVFALFRAKNVETNGVRANKSKKIGSGMDGKVGETLKVYMPRRDL